jgi:TolA-binding protein
MLFSHLKVKQLKAAFKICTFDYSEKQQMKKITLIYLLAMLFLGSSCSNEKDKAYSRIKAIEKELLQNKEITSDSLARVFINLSDEYVKQNSKDEKAPEILFKSAEVASGIGMYDHAISNFLKIVYAYPKFNKAPESLFLIGFIYDSNLMNVDQAKHFYGEFISKYPKHALVKDAAACMENLDIDPAALIKEFQAKEKRK